MRPSLSLPPVARGLGAGPIQAGRSRPGLKSDTPGGVVTSALAVIGPLPGSVCGRRAASFAFASAWIVGGQVRDLSVRVDQLVGEQVQRPARRRRQVGPVAGRDQAVGMMDALRHDGAELAQMHADRVKARALPVIGRACRSALFTGPEDGPGRRERNASIAGPRSARLRGPNGAPLTPRRGSPPHPPCLSFPSSPSP